MYLSRIRLDTDKRNTQIALVSLNKFHGAVESCFECKEERKLWRIDKLGRDYYILILSPSEPDLKGLRAQFGFQEDKNEIKSYDEFLSRIENGSVWQFRLAANPTHSVKKTNGSRGKVTAHVSEKYQMEWLNNKAKQNGFSVLTQDSCVIGSDWKIFYKKDGKSKVRLKETVFQGILKVEDPDLFKKALVNGIGRGKAYGMGLLTVMRV